MWIEEPVRLFGCRMKEEEDNEKERKIRVSEEQKK